MGIEKNRCVTESLAAAINCVRISPAVGPVGHSNSSSGSTTHYSNNTPAPNSTWGHSHCKKVGGDEEKERNITINSSSSTVTNKNVQGGTKLDSPAYSSSYPSHTSYPSLSTLSTSSTVAPRPTTTTSITNEINVDNNKYNTSSCNSTTHLTTKHKSSNIFSSSNEMNSQHRPLSNPSPQLISSTSSSSTLSQSQQQKQSATLSGAKKDNNEQQQHMLLNQIVCIICNEILQEPLLTPCCSRNFCSACVLPDIVAKKTCSFCVSSPVDVQKLSIPSDIVEKISKLEFACEFADQGCKETMRIQNFKNHKDKCVGLLNSTTGSKPDSKLNERQLFNEGVAMTTKTQNDYPKNIQPESKDHDCLSFLNSEEIQKLIKNESEDKHDCVSHVTKLVQGLQMRVTSLETELKVRHNKYSKREKSLLSKVITVQNECQVQAVEYQQKINNLLSQLYFIQTSKQQNETTSLDDSQSKEESKRLEVILQRDENGSFGFNISGGRREDGFSCPIFVSKVSGHSIQTSPQHSPNVLNHASLKLKMNDQIVQVEDVDLTNVSHEEAVHIIKQTVDPVRFTIIRHDIPENFLIDLENTATTSSVQNDSTESGVAKSNNTIGCQTDPFLSFLSDASQWRDCSLTLPSLIDDPELWGSMTDLDNITYDTNYDGTNNTISASPDNSITDLLNDYDIEYEEIVLNKSRPDERLGITICRGSPSTTFSQMIISDIEENSLAAKDGRFQIGDRIAQINGIDVNQDCDISQLFENQDKNDLSIKITISRPLFSSAYIRLNKNDMTDICEFKEQALDEIREINTTRMDTKDNHTQDSTEKPSCQKVANRIEDCYDVIKEAEEKSTETSSVYMDKDSGLDCDSSTRNDSQSETGDQDRAPQLFTETFDQGIYTSESVVSCDNTDYAQFTMVTAKNSPSGAINFSRTLLRSGSSATMQKVKPTPTPDDASISIGGDSSLPFTDEEENVYENVDQDLPEEFEKCEAPSPPPLPKPNLVTRQTSQYQNLYVQRSVKAANKRNPVDNLDLTGLIYQDRSRTPAVIEPVYEDISAGSIDGINEKSTLKLRRKLKSSGICDREYATISSIAPPNTPIRKNQMNTSMRRSKSSQRASQNAPTSQTFQEFNKRFTERSKIKRNDSMLSIPTHAKQYRSYLQLVKLHEKEQSQNAEWKVKIRPDGSRYITKVTGSNSSLNHAANERQRGLNRAKILRDRTEKLNNERNSTFVNSTDDEAVSEMKAGRYWTREERTRQYLVSREKKFRKQMMENSRSQLMEESVRMNLSRKKQLTGEAAAAVSASDRDKILDTFMTIQEIMTHGSNLSSNPLLSVTTV